MKGCFRALEPAVSNHIAKLSPYVVQCGECLLAERASASSMPGVDFLLFSPFFIIFFSC